MVNEELLAILICPACGEGSTLAPDIVDVTLVCSRCARRYPVREGIPVMLLEEAVAAPASDARQAPATQSRRLGATP